MRKGSPVRKATLLTGENVHDDSEVQESRPQARPGRMTLLFLGKEVCVCSQVCVRVSVHCRMRLCVCASVHVHESVARGCARVCFGKHGKQSGIMTTMTQV